MGRIKEISPGFFLHRKYYLQFFLFIFLCLFFFCAGGYFFYRDNLAKATRSIHQEQLLVSGRVKSNIETYLQRVGITIDALFPGHVSACENLRPVLEKRFHTLQKIYPEVNKLALVTMDEQIVFTDSTGHLATAIPVKSIYEWQDLQQKFWWQIGRGGTRATVTELFQFAPAVDKTVNLPVILFAKNLYRGKVLQGTVMIPFQLEGLVREIVKNIPSSPLQVSLVSDRGIVAFSTLPGMNYSRLLPSYAAPSREDIRRRVVDDREIGRAMLPALKNKQAFYCRYELAIPARKEKISLDSYYTPVNVGGTIWTLVVSMVLPGPYAAVARGFLPFFWGTAALIAFIGLVTFWLFYRNNLYFRELALFQAAVENSGDGIFIVDLQGRYLFVNRAYCQITGYAAAELLGRMVYKSPPDLTWEEVGRQMLRTVRAGKVWRGQVFKEHKDGRTIEMSQSVTSIFQDGRLVGYVCSLRDVTEEQQLKRQLEHYSRQLQKEVEIKTRALIQSQKMETVGMLAAGFAHDFNNLLAGFFGNVQLLEMHLEREGKAAASQKYIAKLKELSLRASELVRRILDFSRRSKVLPTRTSLAEIISDSIELASHSLPKNIEISRAGTSDPVFVQVDKSQIMQVMMNIMINARDAIGERQEGRITIASARVFLDEFAAETLNLPRRGWYARISIQDNGPGISAAIIDRIFDPFFSTKEWSSRKGTGIGLSIVYAVINNYEGTIQVESEPGKGTTFSLYLPSCDAGSGEKNVAAVLCDYVDLVDVDLLIVDDEAEIRDSFKDLLAGKGARVLTAANGEEGLEILARKNLDLDAVILDLNMPQMSGEEFLARMAGRHEQLPVVVMTGLGKDGYRLTKKYPWIRSVLLKPFTLPELVNALSFLDKSPSRTVLDEKNVVNQG